MKTQRPPRKSEYRVYSECTITAINKYYDFKKEIDSIIVQSEVGLSIRERDTLMVE